MSKHNNDLWKVYIHTTPSGDVYVGVTTNIKNRWYESQYQTTALKEHIDKWGWEAIDHQVIYTTPDRDEAYQVEEEMRQYYEEKGCCINKNRSGLVSAKDNDAYMRKWKEDHKKEQATYLRQWRKSNPEYYRKWKTEHPEYQRKWIAKKKAEKLAVMNNGQYQLLFN